MLCFFFFKQKTAYEMRISDWSSDVCSSDLHQPLAFFRSAIVARNFAAQPGIFACRPRATASASAFTSMVTTDHAPPTAPPPILPGAPRAPVAPVDAPAPISLRCLRKPSSLQVLVPADRKGAV